MYRVKISENPYEFDRSIEKVKIRLGLERGDMSSRHRADMHNSTTDSRTNLQNVNLPRISTGNTVQNPRIRNDFKLPKHPGMSHTKNLSLPSNRNTYSHHQSTREHIPLLRQADGLNVDRTILFKEGVSLDVGGYQIIEISTYNTMFYIAAYDTQSPESLMIELN